MLYFLWVFAGLSDFKFSLFNIHWSIHGKKKDRKKLKNLISFFFLSLHSFCIEMFGVEIEALSRTCSLIGSTIQVNTHQTRALKFYRLHISWWSLKRWNFHCQSTFCARFDSLCHSLNFFIGILRWNIFSMFPIQTQICDSRGFAFSPESAKCSRPHWLIFAPFHLDL